MCTLKKELKMYSPEKTKMSMGFLWPGNNSAKTARKNENNFDNGYILAIFLNVQIIVNR